MSSTAEELAEERVENVDPASGPPPVKRMPTPREIRRGLNSYVIGQSNVKVALSVGVYNHYKRIFVAEAAFVRAATVVSETITHATSPR